MNAIENGRKDIRTENDFANLKSRFDIAKVHNLKNNLDKNVVGNVTEKFTDNLSSNGSNLLQSTINDIAKDDKSKWAHSFAHSIQAKKWMLTDGSCFYYRHCCHSRRK